MLGLELEVGLPVLHILCHWTVSVCPLSSGHKWWDMALDLSLIDLCAFFLNSVDPSQPPCFAARKYFGGQDMQG